MNSDSTGSMLAPWMSPGVNSPLLRFTAKTSMQRVYDVHFPRRVKNEKQSGAEPQTVQEPLRILDGHAARDIDALGGNPAILLVKRRRDHRVDVIRRHIQLDTS